MECLKSMLKQNKNDKEIISRSRLNQNSKIFTTAPEYRYGVLAEHELEEGLTYLFCLLSFVVTNVKVLPTM